jgi:hypothetical protein
MALTRELANDYRVIGLTRRQPPAAEVNMEFREVLNGGAALVAIHDYRPTIPWPLYNLTQARAHLWVMKNFARLIAKNI